MKLDTQKLGLCALFKPYKAALIKHLYETTEFMSHEGAQGSGDLWNWLEENAERLGIDKMSRASVINGLNDLVDKGILKWRDATGKGGHHRLYSVFLSHEGFEHLVCTTFEDKLSSIFEGDWWRLEHE